MNPVNPGKSEFMGSLTHIDPSAELPESSENDQFKCCGRGRISVHTRPNHSSPYPHPLQSRHACMQSFLTRDAILIWTSRQGFLRYGVELQNLRLSNSKYEEKLKSGVSGLPVYKVPRGVLTGVAWRNFIGWAPHMIKLRQVCFPKGQVVISAGKKQRNMIH